MSEFSGACGAGICLRRERLEIHRQFGPGLNETDLETALSRELHEFDIAHRCQFPLPLVYKGAHLDCGYRMDIVLLGQLILEHKALDKLHPVHEAQPLTYLKLSKITLGLLTNFGGLLLKDILLGI